jgi:hypothetical protein
MGATEEGTFMGDEGKNKADKDNFKNFNRPGR